MSIAAAAGLAGQQPLALPALRADLRLAASAPGMLGERRWTIYDPLQHRFITIDRIAHVLLQLWSEQLTAAELAEAAWQGYAETVEVAEVERLARFLEASGLTVEAPGGGWRRYFADTERRRGAWGSRILHSYLFFCVPLVRPERMLSATLPWARALGSPTSLLLVALAGLAGLYLVSREWDAFATTFGDLFSLDGAALLAVSMIVVKLLHELGHAYTAAHFGCRVPVIGVAFVLGFPMLYCDVTDAWRLESRRQRVLVDSAGVAVDLAVACVATFLWAFLPTGPMKSIAFSLATAGWIFSLAMNLNPFMRFDGYHILADATGMENLQPRGLALARWALREILFELRWPPPEQLPRRARAMLVAYGWATWIYRVVLFTGIALAVYAFFFKLAGIALFAVEIGYFIVNPLVAEIREWTRMRKLILSRRRTAISATVLACLLAMVAVPWSSQVTIPAVVEAQGLARLYPPVPAQVQAVHVAPGARVEAGQALVALAAPSVTEELRLTELRAETVKLRQSRRTTDAIDREQSIVLEQEYEALMQRRAGLLAQLAELDMRAPIAGEVVEVAGELKTGRWVNLKEAVLVVRSTQALQARGTIDAADIWRVRAASRGRFIPDDLSLPALDAEVVAISPAGVSVLDQLELAQSFGGRVPTRLDARRQPVPVSAQYAVRAAIAGDASPAFLRKTVPGVLVVEGEAESLAARMWRQALKVLVRESGV